jgi:hypothetical protein
VSDWNIGPAGKSTGSGWQNSAHVDHLVSFVQPKHEVRGSGENSYETAACSYVVCHSCHRAWADIGVGGTAVAPALNSAEVEIPTVVLVLGEKNVTTGRQAILTEDATPEQNEQAQAVFDKFAVRIGSGRIVFDVDSYNGEAL